MKCDYCGRLIHPQSDSIVKWDDILERQLTFCDDTCMEKFYQAAWGGV
jgi:hypothetical protein